MQFPDALLREQIQKLTGSSILYFKDTTHDENVPPHYNYDFKIEVRDGEIPEELKTQVRTAIKNSPLISNYIKKLI